MIGALSLALWPPRLVGLHFIPPALVLNCANEIRASHTVFPSLAVPSGSDLAQICEYILIR